MLADSVGTSLSTAAAELDKLSVFAGDREVLTADDVVQATGQTREYNVFELQRVVGEACYSDALRISERLLQQSSNTRGECARIIAVLSSFFLKLWQLTGLQKQRIAEKDMARAVGVSPYFLKDYLGSLRQYDQKGLDRAISSLLAADFELKGGSARDERTILHVMLRRMMIGR
jgi:DNA polymerase-3 subunit delta